MCSPSWTLLPLPFPSHPSGLSKCTSPEHPVSCIKPGLLIYFTYSNIHVSMLFSQIIPPSPFPPQSPKVCSLHLCLKTELSVQFSSVPQSCPTLCDPMNRSTPGLPVHHPLLEFTQTHVHWVSDAISHLILCRPLLLLPPIPPSIGVFSNESTLRMRWPKYWSCSFSIIP